MAVTNGTSLMAKDHHLYLGSAADALDAIGSGLPGCIFTESDLSPDFFDLRNGIAGEVFQKFVNYGFRVAFIVPHRHPYSERITELIRDHRNHASIRFFETTEAAEKWLK